MELLIQKQRKQQNPRKQFADFQQWLEQRIESENVWIDKRAELAWDFKKMQIWRREICIAMKETKAVFG